MGNEAKPIARVPDLRQQVYERLREGLRSGRFPADVKLIEHGVARDYGVSRTPAREALAMLAHEGLLRQEGRGYRLPRYTEQEIREVFEVRMRLEPFAVRIAIEAATMDRRAILSAYIVRELDEHAGSDSYVGANARIRSAIFHMCPNEKLRQLVMFYDELTQFVRVKTLLDPETRALSVKLQAKLADQISAGRGKAAETAMEALLNAAREKILEAIRAE